MELKVAQAFLSEKNRTVAFSWGMSPDMVLKMRGFL